MKKISSVLASLVLAVAAAAAQDRPEYIQFLEQNSMLFQADQVADRVSGMGVQWREDFGVPEPLKLVQLASTWLLRYPGSEITPEGASVVRSWSDPAFWAAAHDTGIKLMRTNPI